MVEINFKAIGTDISVKINGTVEDGLEKNLVSFYAQQEKIFSRFDSSSELVRLNENIGRFQRVSKDMAEIARLALEYHLKTDGYFDPRIMNILETIGYDKDFKTADFSVNGKNLVIEKKQRLLSEDLKVEKDMVFFGCRMDFSGIAKGYITDKAAGYLSAQGYENFLVDSGGDIISRGHDENNAGWRISIEGFPEESLTFNLNDEFPAVATSGITRRKWQNDAGKFHHLINPKDPSNFSFDLKSVSVTAESCVEADVWAKTMFLMGREKGLSFGRAKNRKSFFLDYKGNIFMV